MTAKPMREDILVSVCFGEVSGRAQDRDGLSAFAAKLAQVFRFWEIIVVTLADEDQGLLDLVRDIPNLRLIQARRGTEYYRRRAISVAEAIGDVVVLASVEELAALEVLAMVELAAREETIVVGRLQRAAFTDRVLSGPVVAFGRWAGFHVGARDMQTIAFPRTLLNQILAHPAKELALRFLPRDNGLSQKPYLAHAPAGRPRGLRDLGRRVVLAQLLLINLAPRLLQSVTMVSLMVAGLSLFYAVYVVGVWAFKPDVAPGWLTLSGMMAAIGFMLGCVSSGLCLGMQYILSRVEQTRFDDVAAEVNRVDLFAGVGRELNVETDSEPDGQPPR